MTTTENTLRAPAAVAGLSCSAPQRNFGLDAIRAAAISLVVVAHYATIAPVCGVIGVELFFVLSGFLIGGILYRLVLNRNELSVHDLLRFWLRRWMRTLPNYYLFLTVAVAMAAYTAAPVHWTTAWRYLFFLQNLAWAPGAFYGVSWSLAVEEWFYLLFPLSFFLVYLAAGQRPENKRSIFLGAVVFFTLASLALRLGVGKSANWASQMRMIVVYRFDALMFGVALAVVKLESIGWWNRLLRLWPLGVGLLAAAVIIAHRSMLVAPPMMPAAWLLVIFPLGCAMILPRCTRLESTEDWKATIVSCVSKWSYSIYLCHLPILATLLREMHDDQCGLIGKLLVRSAALFLTLGCSSLLFVYLEQPILTFAPKDRY